MTVLYFVDIRYLQWGFRHYGTQLLSNNCHYQITLWFHTLLWIEMITVILAANDRANNGTSSARTKNWKCYKGFNVTQCLTYISHNLNIIKMEVVLLIIVKQFSFPPLLVVIEIVTNLITFKFCPQLPVMPGLVALLNDHDITLQKWTLSMKIHTFSEMNALNENSHLFRNEHSQWKFW